MQITDVFNKVADVVQNGFTLKPEEGARDVQFGHERRAITFDFHGCLLNYRMVTHFVGQIGREHNIPPELTENNFQLYLDRVKFAGEFVTFREALLTTTKYLDMVFNTKVFTKNFDELYLIYNDLQVHQDVLPALERLKNNGYELYLLANCDYQLVSRQFEKLGSFFHDKNIFVTDECRAYKPRIDYFKAASEKFQLRRADHFHVSSDYFSDILPSARLRWLTAYVNRSKTGVFADIEPSVMISSLGDLEEGMAFAKQRIIDEERAAQEREAKAAMQAEAQQRAQEQERKRKEQERQQQQMQKMQQQQLEAEQRALEQRMQQQGGFNDVGVFGGHGSFGAQQGAPGAQMGGVGLGNIDDDLVDFGGQTPGAANQNQYFVPQNQKDVELAAKMQNMNPAKARALARARERALVAARARAPY